MSDLSDYIRCVHNPYVNKMVARVKRLKKELAESKFSSDNTTKSEISKLIRELEVSHTIDLSIDDIILKLRKLSDIC